MLDKYDRIGFFGLGSSNSSLLSLPCMKNRRITIRSDKRINRRDIPSGIYIERIFEEGAACRDMDEELLIFSPSVRRDRKEFEAAFRRGTLFSSDAEIFFSANKMPALAVTGSDGKSTTATVLNLLLCEGGHKSITVGNIGSAMTENLGKADIYVCELSSFMLTYSQPNLKRACITNITPNHLDWHKSFEEYRASKLGILKNTEQSVLTDEFDSAYAIIGRTGGLNEVKLRCKAEVYFTIEDGFIKRNGEKIVSISEMRIKEKHNILNFMMAIAMADGMVDKECIMRVANSFSGLAHRCERFLSRDGVDYYDSSIDSSPMRTIQTLRAIGRPCVVILGGRSKGLDYSVLSPALRELSVFPVITGENAKEIYEAIRDLNPILIEDFEEAVRYATELAQDVGAVVLSPASTSYDRFKNFEERGRFFKEISLKCK